MKTSKARYIIIMAAVALACVTAVTACYGRGSSNEKESTTSWSGCIETEGLDGAVDGYGGPVPLAVYVNEGVVDSVVALPNSETPGVYRRVVAGGLLDVWNGLTVDEALNLPVDGITGATYTSRAIIGNVRLALEQVE